MGSALVQFPPKGSREKWERRSHGLREPSDLEGKADIEPDLLSSSSHFLELCLLGPFKDRVPAGKGWESRLWFRWTSCWYL